MAGIVKKIQAWLANTAPGQIVEALIYAAMLLMTLAYFTGHGAFIYEAF